jgi:hypothetical protein
MERLKFNIQMFALGGTKTAIFSVTPALYIKVVWSATQSSAGNYSDVTADYYYGKSTSGALSTSGTISGTLDGKSGSANITFSFSGAQEFKMFTITKRLYHNSSGYRSFTITANGSIGGGSNTASLSESYDLDRIITSSQYATITSLTAEAQNPTDILVNWATNVSVDLVHYQLNNGDWTWVSNGGTSGSFILNTLPSSDFIVKIRVKNASTQLWTESIAISGTMPSLATISNSVDFNIGTDIPITIQRASANYTVNISMYINDITLVKTVESIGASTTISLTEEEKNIIYNAIPNDETIQVKFVTTTYLETSSYGTTEKNGIATVIDANPIFTNFTYEDTNAVTVALTNANKQTIVKGYSNLRAIISVANKAVAQKGATMTKYRLVVGAKQIDVDYSANSIVNLDLNAIDNNVFTVYAIDSRGNSTSKQISPSIYKDYSPISIASANATRTDSVMEETTLAFNGAIWNDSFGNVANAIQSCTYKYKKVADTTYVNGTTPLTPVLSGNSYSLSSLIAGDKGANGFDIQYSYNLQLTTTDRLSTKTYDLVLQTGKPAIDIFDDKYVSIGDIYNEIIGGLLQIGGYKALTVNEISNVLNGTSIEKALSEAQGKALNDKINGTVLYNNATGTTGTVTLSETSANFSYLEIYYKFTHGNDKSGSIKTDNPNGKHCCIDVSYIDQNTASYHYNAISEINISGTSITVSRQAVYQFGTAPSITYANASIIYITKVVGYK